MDREIIDKKLESLRYCIERIVEKRPASKYDLASDYDLQDIITLNLERAVQLCVDIACYILSSKNIPIPGTMAETFQELKQMGLIDDELATQLKKAVGFRNVAVHNYEDLDYGIVFDIITRNLDDFKNYAKKISELQRT